MATKSEVRAALEKLEKFTILEEIDEGANAIAAFRALDRFLQREIFLKVIYYPQ